MTGTWIAVLVTAAGCYALKLAGLTVPPQVLASPWARRFAELVPVALTARAPFLVVILAAAGTTAGLRALGVG